MLQFLRTSLPPRTAISHLTTIPLDNGRSLIRFYPVNSKSESNSKYLVYNQLPPAPTQSPNEANSSLCPPFHIHLYQDETFHILEGTAKFLTVQSSRSPQPPISDGITEQLASSGDMAIIPKGQIHTFRTASTTSQLSLEFGFNPPACSPSSDPDQMQCFFRNTQGYRSDCLKHNTPRSLLQVLLFNHYAGVALVPQWLMRWPRLAMWMAGPLGKIMNTLGGLVVGMMVCGLKGSYDEYFHK